MSPAPYVLSGEDVGTEVVRRVVTRVLARARRDQPDGQLDDVIQETIYAEERRLAQTPPTPRAAADREFLRWLRRELIRSGGETLPGLIHAIVDRHASEIAGHFDPGIYQVATRMVPIGLGLLLSGLELSNPATLVDDRISIHGQTGILRHLTRLGTVILAPTHVSNLDALVMGAAIHRLGLPPFAYAAGLNLFGNPLLGFFMRHLGAYTVDRKKTDPLYRDTLKEYAATLLERGQHSLLFPGGTRSRSGALESKLKKGILGTAPAAFRCALTAGAERPRIFVVPCTLSYPLVLEAASLIGEYLRTEGGPHSLDLGDEFDHPHRWLSFLRRLRELNQRAHLYFSRPMDWLGNDVDQDGVSRDPRGRPIDPARYLLREDQLTEDPARDAEYTRTLASRIVEAYRRDNVALATGLLAHVVFERLRRQGPQRDLFRFLRRLDPDVGIPEADVRSDLTRALGELAALEARGAIRRDVDLDGPALRVLDRALATFATYHPTPVLFRRRGALHVGDASLLLYYRNRLEGYGLQRWAS